MATITLAEAQAKLPELVRQLAPGEEIAITDGDATVARLTADRPSRYARPLVRQWHWDAQPFLYFVGAIGGGLTWWMGYSPFLGFGIGFGVALLAAAAVFTALTPWLESRDREVVAGQARPEDGRVAVSGVKSRD